MHWLRQRIFDPICVCPQSDEWAEPGETVSSYISLAPPGLCALDLTNGENGSGVSKCLRHLFSNGD